MFKLSEEEKIKLKSVGLDDSDIKSIEKAIFSVFKRNWIIFAIVGFVAGFAGYVFGKLH